MDIDHQVKIILVRIESEVNSKTTQVRPSSVVKDKPLTHLLVKNTSPL